MSSYIHFTEEQKQRAAAVNLEEFLRCRGEKLLSSGREKRLASDHSVTVRGNEWYDHAEERGGHAVSFVQRFYGLSYPDAVTMLLGGELGTAYPSAGERTEEPVKPFALPPANKDMRRVFAYLIKHRSIARDLVAHFAKTGLLYEDAEYHNAVFVGTDTDGVPRHAHKRSANSYGKAFRLNVEGSNPRYSFHHVGTDRSLYVFEAPIDMLSFITLYRKARVHCSLAILKNQLYFRLQYLLLLAPAEGNVFSFKQYLSRRWNQKTAHELSQSAFTRSAFSYQSAK